MSSSTLSSLLSFIAALFLYIFILIGVAFYISDQQKISKRYTTKKDSFMDVTLVARPKKTPAPAPKVSQPKKESKKEALASAQKVSVKSSKPKKTNVRSLFSNIDTSKLEKEAEIPVKESKKQSRLKSNDSQAQPKPQSKASSLVAQLEFESAPKSSSAAGIYDEYRGKISELLEGYWNETPDTVSGAQAVVKVTIDSQGSFSYTIESLSYNNKFNAKLRDFLERMRYITFPASPEAEGITLNVTFKDELELQ
jgi:protein TonB